MSELEQDLQRQLGKAYAIQGELTGGGMSRVFLGNDVALHRKVVIKVMNPALAATVNVERFAREIMLVARLNHPNIVPVLSAGEVNGYPYFIMPFIEGDSLRQRILRGPLSVRETLAIFKDVARALAYAHGMGVVHRDIKPDNILFGGNAAVVTDFGVAKAVSASRDRGPIRAGQVITGVGISLGTPQYMAPEQAAADPNVDGRADIYALGIVTYEMLVGSPPFHGRTPQALLAAQLTELPAPLASRRYDIPSLVADLIMKCLEKDPADRPRSALELVHLLDDPEVMSSRPAVVPGAAARRSMRAMQKVLLLACGAAALIALVMWSLRPDATAPTSNATPPPRTAIRVAAPSAIGTGAPEMAAALDAAIETRLARSGLNVTREAANAPRDSSALRLSLTVQRVGDQVRANFMLHARGDSLVWAEQMDYRLKDALATQDSAAARVARAIVPFVR